MTREELKRHCEKQIESCEMWARCKGEEPHGNIYEEHKLILELLEQETVSKEVYDHEYFLRKELELKIDKLQRQLKALEQESIDYKTQYERFSKRAEIVISQLRSDRDRLLEVLDKIKKVVAKWETDNFTDGFSWDCMKEIADIADKKESEE